MAGRGSIYGTIVWINPNGELRDFCGVVSQAGDVVFKFLIEQHSPDKVLMPLAIADNGTRAAVALGEKIVDDAEDGMVELVGHIREVFIWENGKQRSTKKLPKFENTNELGQYFLENKL